MAIVGVQSVLLRQIEGVAVFHQELAPPHHAEPRPHLVAELPLDMVQRQRQVLVTADGGPEDVGDHLFVRRTVKHVAALPVGDAQHLVAIGVVAAAFTPQVGRLQRRHQKRQVPDALLFLVHDGLDPGQHLETQRQP